MKGNSCYQTMLVCAAIAIALAGQIIAGPTTIPFADDFSFYTNGTPLVNGTNGWYADTDSVVVQSGVEGAIGANSNAAVLPIDTTLSNRFQNVTATNVWTHLYTKVAKYDGTNPPVIDTNATVQFYVNSNGYFVMANGTNWEESQTFQVTNEDEWLTIDIFQDYDNKMWWMFVNGTNLTNSSSLYPLPPKQQMFTNTVYTNSFISFTIPKFTGFDLYNGGGSTSYLSHVTVADVDRLPYVYARPTNIFQNVVPTAPNTQAVLRVISRAMGVSHYSIITNGENWFTLCDNDTGDPLPGNYSSTLTNASTNYILINFRTNDLAVGTPSNAIITLTSPNWGGTTQQIPVRLAIVNLSVSPLLLTNAMLYQGTPYTYTVQVQNVGPGSMAYQIALNDPQGLGIQATPQGDTNNLTSTPQDVLVDFNLPIIQAMPPGGIEDYEAGFFVTSTNDGGVTQSVSMVLAIYSKPVVDDGALLPYPFFYDITIHRGQQPSNITFSIRNNAWDQPRCYLDFRATSDAPWMVCNTSGRSVNGEWVNVPITFDNMTNYPGGVYQGKVHVHSWDGGAPILYSPTNTVIFTNEFSVTLTIISPGKPGGLTASEGTYTDKIRLSWLDTTNAATYRIYKATTSDFAQATILVDGLTELTYDDTNSILPGRYNYYWASAINEYGGEGSTSSMAIGYASLAAPMNVQASDGLYTNKVAITWQTVTGPTGYEVWRNTLNSTSGVNFIKLGTVSSSTTNYDDTTATINVTYYYFVRSITPDIGTFSASDSGWRAACLPPGGVSATKGIYTDKVRISWNAAVNVTYYDVFRATTTNSSSAVLIGSRDASGQSYDDTNVTAGTVYYYWVKSRNNNGSSIFSSRDYGYTKLAAPSGVSATQTHPYHIQVSWNAVSGATSYQVYKSKSSSSSSATLAGETTSRSYLAQDTIAGVTYYFWVKAKNALATSDFSSSASGKRLARTASSSEPAINDFDGDKISDLALFNTQEGKLYVLRTTSGLTNLMGAQVGISGYVGVWGDYEGDGISDPVAYRQTTGKWIVLLSSMGYAPVQATMGGPGYVPVSADYDGDGIIDAAVYSATAKTIKAILSGSGWVPVQASGLGGSTYKLYPVDGDGDGKADLLFYDEAAGKLIVHFSGSGYVPFVVNFGGPGKTFLAADFDRDGKADPATYTRSNGKWFVLLSSSGYAPVQVTFGSSAYMPVIGDYDGDGAPEPGLYAATNGAWRLMFSSSGYSTNGPTTTLGGTNYQPLTVNWVP